MIRDSSKFDPSAVDVLNKPRRHREINPRELVRWAGIREKLVVLDVGCGAGFFTRAAAALIGPQGRTVGLDTSREMLQRFAAEGRPSRVLIAQCEEDAYPLQTGSVDVAILGFVLHEAQDPQSVLREVRRILRTEGKVLIVEWAKRNEQRGPQVASRLSPEDVRPLLRRAGFMLDQLRQLGESYYALTAVNVPVYCCAPARAVHF